MNFRVYDKVIRKKLGAHYFQSCFH